MLEAEDRRWECEYRLAENENARLRTEVNSLKNELETMNQDLTSTTLYRALKRDHRRASEKSLLLE